MLNICENLNYISAGTKVAFKREFYIADFSDINDYPKALTLFLNKIRPHFDINKPKANINIDAIIIHINKNCFQSDFSIKEMAELFQITPANLSYFFKSRTQKTVQEYVNDLKIERSKYLLDNTDKSILEIATAVGYNDASSFIRRFKDATGVTPKKYRTNLSVEK